MVNKNQNTDWKFINSNRLTKNWHLKRYCQQSAVALNVTIPVVVRVLCHLPFFQKSFKAIYLSKNPKDCTYFIVYIKDTLLNLLIDFFGCSNKCFFDIGCCFGRRFHENETVFSSECLSFLLFDFTPCLQVTKKRFL